MKKTLFLLVLIGLTGCETPEEENMRLARERSADISTCESFGFATGTDGMASCMMQQNQNRIAQQAAKDQAFSEMMRRNGEQMRQQQENQRQMWQQNRPVHTNCTRSPYGGTVNCTTY